LDTLKEKIYKLNNENTNLKEKLLDLKENNNFLSNQKKEILRENNIKSNIQNQNILKEQEIDFLRKKWEEEIKIKLERELGDISVQFNEEKENYQNEINNLNEIIAMKEEEIYRLEQENEHLVKKNIRKIIFINKKIKLFKHFL
jgi:hypothetical protein